MDAIFLPFELKKLKVKHLYSPMNFGPIFLRILELNILLLSILIYLGYIFSKMPGNIIRNFLTRFLMEMSIYSCDNLIVDSNFAKKEIVKILRINEEKVYVIYLGIDKNYLDFEENFHHIKDFDYENYIISVLSCVKYHNIINLLKAFKLIKQKNNEELKFVLVMQILDKDYYFEITIMLKKL